MIKSLAVVLPLFVAGLVTILGWFTYTSNVLFAAQVNWTVRLLLIFAGCCVAGVLLLRYGVPAFFTAAESWSRLKDAQLDRHIKLSRYAPSSTGLYELPAAQVEGGAFLHSMQLATVHSQYEEPRLALQPSAPAMLSAPPAAALTLPDEVKLSDYRTRAGNRFALGMKPDGELLTLALPDVWHLLNNAQSGGGKSNNIDSFITQVHYLPHGNAVEMYGMDFKGELKATWKRSPLFMELATQSELTSMVDMAEGLVSTIHERNRIFEAYADESGRIVKGYKDYTRLSGDGMPLVYLVVDEMNALMGYAKKDDRLESALGVLLQMGRSAGVNVLMGAQHLTADVLPKGYYTNIATRVMLGQYDSTNMSRLLGTKPALEVIPLLTGQPGRALVRSNGAAAPVVVQMLRVDEQDILDSMSYVRRARGAAPVDSELLAALLQPSSEVETLKPAVSAYESGETDFKINPETVEIVRRLKVSGQSKAGIIEIVWGAKPGATKAYKSAQAAYEQIINAQN